MLGAAGGVGLAAIDVGKALGAYVIACASNDDKLAVCREHGADATINYAQSEDLRESESRRSPMAVALTSRATRTWRTCATPSRPLRSLSWRGASSSSRRLRRRRDSEDSAQPAVAWKGCARLSGCRSVASIGASRLGRFAERVRRQLGRWFHEESCGLHVSETMPFEQGTLTRLARMAARSGHREDRIDVLTRVTGVASAFAITARSVGESGVTSLGKNARILPFLSTTYFAKFQAGRWPCLPRNE